MKKQDNFWTRLNKQFAGSRLGRWVGSRILHRMDRVIASITGGRITLSRILGGVTPIWLSTIGAKSGKKRTVPLIGLQDGDRVIIVASNWGQKHFPAWYYNLLANPQAEIQIGQNTNKYKAILADGEAYQKYWKWAVDYYPGYANYKISAGEREIPIFILTPLSEQLEDTPNK